MRLSDIAILAIRLCAIYLTFQLLNGIVNIISVDYVLDRGEFQKKQIDILIHIAFIGVLWITSPWLAQRMLPAPETTVSSNMTPHQAATVLLAIFGICLTAKAVFDGIIALVTLMMADRSDNGMSTYYLSTIIMFSAQGAVGAILAFRASKIAGFVLRKQI